MRLSQGYQRVCLIHKDQFFEYGCTSSMIGGGGGGGEGGGTRREDTCWQTTRASVRNKPTKKNDFGERNRFKQKQRGEPIKRKKNSHVQPDQSCHVPFIQGSMLLRNSWPFGSASSRSILFAIPRHLVSH